MLLIIFTCKFILKDNIEFTKILNYSSLASKNSRAKVAGWVIDKINKIISIWKISSNLWIYFILFNLLVFNSASILSIYNLLVLLK
jgi:hypothetical protein